MGELCWGGSCKARNPPSRCPSLPSRRSSCQGIPVEIFPSQRRGRAGRQQLSSVRGGDCSPEAPAPPPQRLLSPSGVLLQVRHEDTLTTWGGFPRRPETCCCTAPASRSPPKHSLGESEQESSGLYLSSALPRRALARVAPPASARAQLRHSPAVPRARPHVPLLSRLHPGARPLAPPPRALTLAHAHAAPGGPRRCHGGEE